VKPACAGDLRARENKKAAVMKISIVQEPPFQHDPERTIKRALTIYPQRGSRTMNSAKTQQDARVDAAWIASHIDDPSVRCVEVDVSGAAYKAGHIPGAVLWNAYTDLRHPDYRPISAPELQALLCRSGVTPDMTVVFYGYGAHLGFWLLKSCGHDRVRLMDGSREQWKVAGQNWSTDVATPARSQYVLAAQDAYAS
jgi:3-mercaptopyruvate sulfurtransferase SseA